MYKNSKKENILIIFTCLFILVYSFIDIIKSILIGQFIDNDALTTSLSKGFIIIFIFLLLYLFVGFVQQYMNEYLKVNIRYKWNERLYTHFLKEDQLNVSNTELINTFGNKIDVLIDKYVSSQLSMFRYIISFILGSVYIGMLNYKILLFLYVCALLIAIVNHCFSDTIRKNQEESIQSNEKWMHSIQNFGYNFDVVKNYQRENWIQKELDEKNYDLCKKQLNSNGLLNVLSMLNDGIGQWMFFGTILFGVLLIHVGHMKVGTLISIVQASNMVVGPITGFMSLKNRIDASKCINDELKAFIHEREIVKKDELEHLHSIQLNHVNFGYHQTILEDLNYIFNEYEKYLIIGQSGSGKSTLLSILDGSLNCDGIYWNDTNSQTYTSKSFLENISFIKQNEHVFANTLKENISLGSTFGDEIMALNKACANDLVDRINEQLEENGNSISGGQKQKIALARAFYYGRKWLLLDESFASLDQESEYQIENDLLEDPTLTLILVSHKVNKNVFNKFDHVLLVKDKKLVEITDKGYQYALNWI